MKIIEFKRPDGKPVYVNAQYIVWWMESPDNSNHTELQVNGGKLYFGETFAEVTKKIEEA